MKFGYNRYQVDDKVQELNAEIELLQRQLNAYQKQGEADASQILELRNKLSGMQNELTVREKAAADLTQLALKEANAVISNATKNADLIIKEAILSAKEILVDMSKLGVEAQEMKEHMNEQLELLTSALDNFEVPPIPSKELLDACDE